MGVVVPGSVGVVPVLNILGMFTMSVFCVAIPAACSNFVIAGSHTARARTRTPTRCTRSPALSGVRSVIVLSSC